MHRPSARWTASVVVVAAVLIPAAIASACVAVMAFRADTSSAEPGDTVVVSGGGFAQDEPVQIRFGSPDGEVLATVPPPESTMTGTFEIEVVIPDDAAAGETLLVATQNAHHMNAGSPARATVFVGTAAPAPPEPPARPLGVEIGSDSNLAGLVLIGVAVAAVAVLAGGLYSRRAAGGGQPPPDAAAAS